MRGAAARENRKLQKSDMGNVMCLCVLAKIGISVGLKVGEKTGNAETTIVELLRL